MKIGIDVTPAINQTAGISRYTRQLVTNLLQIDNRNQYLLYSLFGNSGHSEKRSDEESRSVVYPEQSDGPLRMTNVHSNVNLRHYNYPQQVLKSFFLLSRMFGRSPDFLTKEADLMHSTDFVLPASKKKPSVLTVHDLIFLRSPQFYTWRNRRFMKSMARFSAKNATAIITCSEATKKDLVDFLEVKEEKITVIYDGVEKNFKPATAEVIEKIIKEYQVPKKYLLTVGTLEPRKNLIHLFEAFARVNKSLDYMLVVVGQRGWLYKDILKKLQQLNLEKRVIFIDSITEHDLSVLYSGAKVFIYPSLYEGFGLPPLEAMACGTPVVCSNTSSLPEVVGDAALQVNPTNTEEITNAVSKIIEDENLEKDLGKKGIEQAKKFNWQTTAEKTLKIYQQFAN